MTEPLLSLTELAQQLQRPRGWIWRLASSGQIPFIRIGRQYYFRPDDVQQWLAAHTVQPKPVDVHVYIDGPGIEATAMRKIARRSRQEELEAFGLSEEDMNGFD